MSSGNHVHKKLGRTRSWRSWAGEEVGSRTWAPHESRWEREKGSVPDLPDTALLGTSLVLVLVLLPLVNVHHVYSGLVVTVLFSSGQDAGGDHVHQAVRLAAPLGPTVCQHLGGFHPDNLDLALLHTLLDLSSVEP